MSSEKRSRNADATRNAILTSARAAFARAGYDGAGVREIAAGAGVTAMLVNRYFGSKAGLFSEAVAATMQDPVISRPEVLEGADRGVTIARALVALTDPQGSALDGFLILLKSAGSEDAAAIGRRAVEAGHLKTMTAAIHGANAAERAATILSLVAGFQMMRQMMALSPLVEGDAEDLVSILAPVFDLLLDGASVS